MKHTMSRRRKRFWSDEEKLEICRQTAFPGASVVQVARLYAVNVNLIFKWLKDPRFAQWLNEGAAEAVFPPVEVVPPEFEAAPEPEPTEPVFCTRGRIKIELAGGYRISAEGGFDPEVLVGLLKGILS